MYTLCHENRTKIQGGKTFVFINMKIKQNKQNSTQQMHVFE